MRIEGTVHHFEQYGYGGHYPLVLIILLAAEFLSKYKLSYGYS